MFPEGTSWFPLAVDQSSNLPPARCSLRIRGKELVYGRAPKTVDVLKELAEERGCTTRI